MKHFALAFSLTTLLSLNACVTTPKSTGTPAAQLDFAEHKVKVDAFWVRPPVLETEQFLRLEVRDSKTGELTAPPHELSVSVWTKTHSYGLVEPTVSPALDSSGKALTGVYNVSGIYFLASGQWEVRVYLKDQSPKQPMQTFAVDLGQEKPNPMHDPKSPMHQMMNKPGGMDHSKHMAPKPGKDGKPAPKPKPGEKPKADHKHDHKHEHKHEHEHGQEPKAEPKKAP